MLNNNLHKIRCTRIAKTKRHLAPLYMFITRCISIADVIRNANDKNNALYIILFGDLC